MNVRKIHEIFKLPPDDLEFSRAERRAPGQVPEKIAPDDLECVVLRNLEETFSAENFS
ncbi:MAG: hypothetical protein O3B01_20780 [Planctomycetota bacterium]|nr:hypothetical protein [Planctomycetota bacterium]MDA1141009.1 hypothetical protein [Planctomycetota bacterium]